MKNLWDILLFEKRRYQGPDMGTPDMPHPFRRDITHRPVTDEWTGMAMPPHMMPAQMNAHERKLHVLLSRDTPRLPLYGGERYHMHNYKDQSQFYNEPLRAGQIHSHNDEWERGIKHLDKLTSDRTKRSFVAYRGFYDHLPREKMKVGHVFQDHGYTGVSITTKTPYGVSRRHWNTIPYAKTHHQTSPVKYSNDDFSKPGDVLAYPHQEIGRIHIPVGTKGHYFDAEHTGTPHSNEMEFVIHRGTHFKVLGHSYDNRNNTHYIDLGIHHQEDHDGFESIPWRKK